MMFAALVLLFAILTGCASTSEELAQNNQNTEQPSANQGSVKIDTQLFTPNEARMAAAPMKAGGSYIPTELDLRKKIDHVDFFVTDQFSITRYIDTIAVIDGKLTGVLNIEEGSYQLETRCMTAGGVDLYYDYQAVTITAGQETAITLVLKKRDQIWVPCKISNLPEIFLAEQVYDFTTTINFSGNAWVDQQRVFQLSFPYDTFENKTFNVTLYDYNGFSHPITITTNLLADIDESNLKGGYTEQVWPEPGNLSIDVIFEADGGFLQAIFASQTAQPHSYTNGAILSYINFVNGSGKDAAITEVTYDVWDATTISNFSLHIYDLQIGTCEVISRTDYGQAVVKCYPNHVLPVGAMTTFALHADISNYPTDRMLSIGVSGAVVTDSDGNPIAFSGTDGGMGVMVQQ